MHFTTRIRRKRDIRAHSFDILESRKSSRLLAHVVRQNYENLFFDSSSKTNVYQFLRHYVILQAVCGCVAKTFVGTLPKNDKMTRMVSENEHVLLNKSSEVGKRMKYSGRSILAVQCKQDFPYELLHLPANNNWIMERAFSSMNHTRTCLPGSNHTGSQISHSFPVRINSSAFLTDCSSKCRMLLWQLQTTSISFEGELLVFFWTLQY